MISLEEALLLIESENNDNNINENTIQQKTCMITKMPIKNEMQLKCGHCFEYYAIYNELMTQIKHVKNKRNCKLHKCPYCRATHNDFIPYYDIHEMKDERAKFPKGIMNIFFQNSYLNCEYVYKSGKNKNTKCNNYAHKFDDRCLCFRHHSQIMSKTNSSPSSKANTKSCVEHDPSKMCNQKCANGKFCYNKKAENTMNYCKMHYNKYIKQLNQNTIVNESK